MKGAGFLLRGLGLWRTRPGLMALGVVPALIVLAVLLAGLVTLTAVVGDVVAWATPFARDWTPVLRGGMRLLLAVAVLLGAAVGSTLVFTGLTLAVGDPFYERIWRATEELLGDPPVGGGPGFWRSARDGAVLAGIGLLLSVLLLVVGFLPVVGTAVALAGGLLVSGRLLALELLSRPLEARGLDRRARRDLVATQRATVWSFGVATQACFLVPGGAVAVMPAAVAGATMLARDLLAES